MVVEQYRPGFLLALLLKLGDFIVKKIAIMAVVAPLAMAALALPHSAQAAGCVRGAIAGGVIGHYAGHHGLLGAGVGCAYEHHEATKRMREQDYDYNRDRR
jgi:uncharacterized protein YcfJ